jgi:hypothetical protein
LEPRRHRTALGSTWYPANIEFFVGEEYCNGSGSWTADDCELGLCCESDGEEQQLNGGKERTDRSLPSISGHALHQ